MPVLLTLAVLLALAHDRNAPSQEAGISFIHNGNLRAGERIRFRADAGAGWDTMPIHRGPEDRGMFDHAQYDQPLSPGSKLTVETSVMRKGVPTSHVTMRLTIEADRSYFVHAVVQERDPTLTCMGCVGVRSAPITGDSSRRLWVYYSFNGISHPILF